MHTLKIKSKRFYNILIACTTVVKSSLIKYFILNISTYWLYFTFKHHLMLVNYFRQRFRYLIFFDLLLVWFLVTHYFTFFFLYKIFNEQIYEYYIFKLIIVIDDDTWWNVLIYYMRFMLFCILICRKRSMFYQIYIILVLCTSFYILLKKT